MLEEVDSVTGCAGRGRLERNVYVEIRAPSLTAPEKLLDVVHKLVPRKQNNFDFDTQRNTKKRRKFKK